ncbi:MAG: pyrroline-5-carboxylate reductase [Verrucomicrobia bacterium]|nr:pyrroline-5-carboxylate reductase [Verrucomicrobiota bacterium]
MKLGVIGCGKMGSALLEGILNNNIVSSDQVLVYDTYSEAVDRLVSERQVKAATSNDQVVSECDSVLLCVKPQGLLEMLESLTGTSDHLLISIAAGVRISNIEAAVENRHRIIRVMPNTPALVGKGASAFALGSTATETDAKVARELLEAVGYVTEVPEKLLDPVTALSGSGPAYIFAMIESMIKAGTALGLDDKTALDLAVHTVSGAAELILQTGDSPTTLRENVTSPNGTTFAALESLKSNHFDTTIHEAMKAACDRSIELGE